MVELNILELSSLTHSLAHSFIPEPVLHGEGRAWKGIDSDPAFMDLAV